LLGIATVASAAVGAAPSGYPGDLDPTFGTNGTVVTSFPEQVAAGASGIAVQGRNLVVGGGGLSSTAPDFLLARYRGDGTLDPRFGEGGRVITPMPSADGANGVEAVAVQPDRRIVAVGTAGLGSGNNIGFAVARYLPDGKLDKTFGVNGVTITPVGPVGDGGASGLAIQPDGKIVVVGGANDDDNNANFAVARYLPNGTLDTAFGNAGTLLLSLAGGDAAASAVALQADGKVVVAGTAIGPGVVGQEFAVVRLTDTGALDPTFGDAGIVLTQNLPGQQKGGLEDIIIGRDGRILVAGLGEVASGQGAFALLRFHTDGSLDSTFGGGTGKVLTEFPGGSGASSVLVQHDGRIVAAGAAGVPTTFALAGYLPDGTLDTGFGTCGRTTTAIGENSGISGAVLVQHGRRIVVAGTTFNSTVTAGSFALARYLGKKAHDGYGSPPPEPCTA
jgi:uncharacterized delta-60 repeat protein